MKTIFKIQLIYFLGFIICFIFISEFKFIINPRAYLLVLFLGILYSSLQSIFLYYLTLFFNYLKVKKKKNQFVLSFIVIYIGNLFFLLQFEDYDVSLKSFSIKWFYGVYGLSSFLFVLIFIMPFNLLIPQNPSENTKS